MNSELVTPNYGIGASMQRWTALLFVALVLGALALVLVKGGAHTGPESVPFGADAGAIDAGAALGADAAFDAESPSPQVPSEGEPGVNSAGSVDAGGTLLLSGESAPPVGASAPKSVVFGVVLVTYRGAQGAPATARSRDAALALANDLALVAAKDFKAAVAKGDKGSMENAGRLPRGILEPAPEYVLFKLAKGEVGGPVDTPKGYWIVQRIE